MNDYKSDKLDSKFDAGPLITLKKGLNLEELKKNASVEDRFIDLIIKIINSGKKKQRFAVNWRAGQDQKLMISIGATVDADATEDEIEELKNVGGHAIVPKKGVPGIVHEELETMEFNLAQQQGISALFEYVKCIYKGGLSFIIEHEYKEDFIFENLELVFSNRSFQQSDSQEINFIGKLCLFYEFSDKSTQYDAKANEFRGREYTQAHQIERSSILFITKLLAETILNALLKREKDIQLCSVVLFKDKINYSNCNSIIFEAIWKEKFRYNKPNIADALLTTICIACGYHDSGEPGPGWSKLSDDEIVLKSVESAKKAGIKLDLNKVPDPLKDICNQPDFSTTALMFAAKKTDIPVEKRLNLIAFLLKHGADSAQQDKNGHDALWYAENAGNTEVAEYLRMTMSFHHSPYQGPTSELFSKKHSLDNNNQTSSVIQEAQPISLR